MMMRLDCSFGIFQSNSKCFNEGKGLKFGFSLWFPYDDICIFFFHQETESNLNKEGLFISRGFPVYSAFPDWSFSSRWPNNYLIRCSNRFILVSVSACSSLPFKNLLLIFLINAWEANLSEETKLSYSAFFISLFKSLFGKIFTIIFRTSNDQIASKKIWTEFSLKVFRPEIKFHTYPGLP